MARLSILLIAALLVSVIDGGAAVSGSSPSQPPSLCAAGETIVFACGQDHKTISLCSAPATGGGGKTQLRYVYGTPAKVEIEVAQAAHPDAFSSGVSALSGGGIDYVRVRSGDYAYVLYTGLSPGWSQDGWIVETRGAAVSHHICRRAATGPEVWGPVYAAKLATAPDEGDFHPPDWVGAAPAR